MPGYLRFRFRRARRRQPRSAPVEALVKSCFFSSEFYSDESTGCLVVDNNNK